MPDAGERPAWDVQRAEKLIGARVLIGITYIRPDTSEQQQMFGVIKSVDARSGFEVELEGARAGETFWLPPDLRNFSPANPGEYRLRTTGEIVVNPDYTSTWTIKAPMH